VGVLVETGPAFGVTFGLLVEDGPGTTEIWGVDAGAAGTAGLVIGSSMTDVD
jgi:hypothetical protein